MSIHTHTDPVLFSVFSTFTAFSFSGSCFYVWVLDHTDKTGNTVVVSSSFWATNTLLGTSQTKSITFGNPDVRLNYLVLWELLVGKRPKHPLKTLSNPFKLSGFTFHHQIAFGEDAHELFYSNLWNFTIFWNYVEFLTRKISWRVVVSQNCVDKVR